MKIIEAYTFVLTNGATFTLTCNHKHMLQVTAALGSMLDHVEF